MLKSVEYEYDKISAKGEIVLDGDKIVIKHCNSNTEKSIYCDCLTRVLCDNFKDIQVSGAIGMPSYLLADFEEYTISYDNEDTGENLDEFFKVITTEGTTLRTYLINEDKSDKLNICCNSSFYNEKINEYFYRLVETNLKFLYSGVSVVYEKDRIRLKYQGETDESTQQVIYLVYSLLSEVILSDCSVYIVSDNLVGLLGADVLRKFKRIIKGLDNVKRCILLY